VNSPGAPNPYTPNPQYPPPGDGYPPPGAHAQPPKSPQKKGKGCLIAVAIVGGVLLLGGIGVGVAVWRFASSEEGKKIVSAVSSGAQMVQEAQTAPGTAELRALGCKQALVVDLERARQLAAMLGDAGEPLTADDTRVLVTCQTAGSAKEPTCDAVATTYVKAVGGAAAGRFRVTVGDNNKSSCEHDYAPNGTR
jgi:hypothetical protein